jgi:hypothetical protein
VTVRAGEPGGADIILTPLQENRLEVLSGQPLHQGDVLVEKLLLEIDRVRADESLASRPLGMEDGGEQVGQRLADAGSRLNDQMGAAGERRRDPRRHALLLGTPLESPDRGKASLRAEERGHFAFERPGVRRSTGRILLIDGNHGVVVRVAGKRAG